MNKRMVMHKGLTHGGSQKTLTYDASGRPLRTVDANGLVTQITYTPRGWTDLIRVGTDSVYETTDLEYDGVGQLIKPGRVGTFFVPTWNSHQLKRVTMDCLKEIAVSNSI